MKQLIVGITGGIGCGISEVARRLGILGAAVINVDTIARSVVEEDKAVLSKLRETFGNSYFNQDGKLNRDKLGKLIFSDNKAREKLNNIVHPPMLQRVKAEIETHLKTRETKLITVDAALIYELGIEDDMDYTVVVQAPLKLRRERIHIRDGLTNKDINNRIQAQIPLEEKIQKADYVVSNTGSLIDLDKEVQSLYRWLKVRLKEEVSEDK